MLLLETVMWPPQVRSLGAEPEIGEVATDLHWPASLAFFLHTGPVRKSC